MSIFLIKININFIGSQKCNYKRMHLIVVTLNCDSILKGISLHSLSFFLHQVPSVSGPELVMMFVDPRAPPAIQDLPSHLYSLSGLWANQPGNCTFNPVDSLQYPTNDCESQYTYCTEIKQDGCGWLINNRYKECFIDRETAWAKRELRRATWGGSLQGRSIRVGGRRFGCSPNAPEDEFHQCMRREVAEIVTQFLRPN